MGPGELLPRLSTLTDPKIGGISLLHYPGSRLRRTLSVILPCEARTFLIPRPFGITVRDSSTCSFVIIQQSGDGVKKIFLQRCKKHLQSFGKSFILWIGKTVPKGWLCEKMRKMWHAAERFFFWRGSIPLSPKSPGHWKSGGWRCGIMWIIWNRRTGISSPARSSTWFSPYLLIWHCCLC